MAAEVPYTLGPHDPATHESCPVCYEEFAGGDQVIACPRCKQVHHAACWTDRGGCARLGCPQIATIVREDRPRLTDDDRAKVYNPPTPRWIPWTIGFLIALTVLGIPLLRTYVFRDDRPALVVMIPTTDDFELIAAAVEEWAKLHPDLQVHTNTAPSGSLFQQKLAVLIGARDAPDIFVLPWGSFTNYAVQGMYLDITEWVESKPAVLANLPAERLERGRIEGRWYGVPHPSRSAFFGVFVNTELPEEAIDLLEHILSKLPVDEEVDDVFRVDTALPTMRMLPGF